jgi:hypothetical protein
VPTCAFNGGHDVFVDIGSKALGLTALQGLLGTTAVHTVHVGDRFTHTGNDFRARDCASTLWVASPANTLELLHKLVPLVIAARSGQQQQQPMRQPASLAAVGAGASFHGSSGGLAGGGSGDSTSNSSNSSSRSSMGHTSPFFSIALASSSGEGASTTQPSSLFPSLHPILVPTGMHRARSTGSFLNAGSSSPEKSPREGVSRGHSSTSGGERSANFGIGAEGTFSASLDPFNALSAADQNSVWKAAGGEVIVTGMQPADAGAPAPLPNK